MINYFKSKGKSKEDNKIAYELEVEGQKTD